jgi:hypothetical protein
LFIDHCTSFGVPVEKLPSLASATAFSVAPPDMVRDWATIPLLTVEELPLPIEIAAPGA